MLMHIRLCCIVAIGVHGLFVGSARGEPAPEGVSCEQLLLTVRIAPTKADGRSWDSDIAGGGSPDPFGSAALACTGGLRRSERIALREDTFEVSAPLYRKTGVTLTMPCTLAVKIRDKDLRGSDGIIDVVLPIAPFPDQLPPSGQVAIAEMDRESASIEVHCVAPKDMRRWSAGTTHSPSGTGDGEPKKAHDGLFFWIGGVSLAALVYFHQKSKRRRST